MSERPGKESEPVPSGSEIAISDQSQSRAAASNSGSDVHRPISRLERELFVKLADPIQSLWGRNPMMSATCPAGCSSVQNICPRSMTFACTMGTRRFPTLRKPTSRTCVDLAVIPVTAPGADHDWLSIPRGCKLREFGIGPLRKSGGGSQCLERFRLGARVLSPRLFGHHHARVGHLAQNVEQFGVVHPHSTAKYCRTPCALGATFAGRSLELPYQPVQDVESEHRVANAGRH